MLVSNNVYKNRYVYDGAQFNFPISFPFLDEKHIQVRYAKRGQEDTDSHIMNPSYYMITGVGNPAGGVLTRLSNWEPGIVIVIIRDVPITQLHQYTQYDNFPAESHEDALAKLTMICQELDEICSRAITVPATSKKTPQEWWKAIYDEIMHARDQVLAGLTLAGNVTGATMVVADGTTTPRSISDRFADIINVKDFGAVGDGERDDTEALERAIVYAGEKNKTVYIPSGIYNISKMSFAGSNYHITGDNATIYSKKSSVDNPDYAIRFIGENKEYRVDHPFALTEGATDIPLNSLNAEAGDLIAIYSTHLVPTDHRDFWCSGCVCKVDSVSATNGKIYLKDALPMSFDEGTEDLVVSEAISKTQCKFSAANYPDRDDMRYFIECVSGPNTGEAFAITDWDNTTKVATFGTRSTNSGSGTGWSNVPQPGETYRLKRKHTVSVWSPVKVHLEGSVHLTRDLVTTASPGDPGYKGLHILWADTPVVSGWEVSNFSECNVNIESSYRPDIHDVVSRNANRLYNGTDGTGYAYSFSGCYGAHLHDFVSSGCRSGLSNGHAGLTDIYSRYENGIVYAGRTVTYTGENMFPVQIKHSQYGFGGHGNSYKNSYTNITVVDCNAATSFRDWNCSVEQCKFVGTVRTGLYIQNVKGLTVDGCHFKPIVNDALGITHFVTLRGTYYNQDATVCIKNSRAENLTDSFMYIGDLSSGQLITNLYVHGCYIRFSDVNSDRLVGIRGNTNDFLIRNCEFYNNNLQYDMTTLPSKSGFFNPAYFANTDITFVNRVGMNQWVCYIKQNEEAVIHCANNYTQTRQITISTHDGTVACMMLLYSNYSADYSPLNWGNASNVNVQTSAVDVKPDNLNVYMENGRLHLVNKMSKHLRLLVSIAGME